MAQRVSRGNQAVVSLLIEHLGSIAIEGIGEETRLVIGVREDVKKLKTHLEDIQVVLEDAEQKQLNDAVVKRWLQKLKNASEEIENILDDRGTALLQYKIKKEQAKKFQGFLCITGCGNLKTTMDDVAKLDLSSKQHVLKLVLEFRSGIQISGIENDMEILNFFHPPPSLRWLEISNYRGFSIPPAWTMSLSSLTRLLLSLFKNGETLRLLGTLPSLKYLKVHRFSKMCTVGEEFLGITEADRELILFPKLEELHFNSCFRWRDWEGCCKETTKIMPCLRTLSISFCESLETLPEFLQMTPLQKLSIWGSKTLQNQFWTGRERMAQDFSCPQHPLR